MTMDGVDASDWRSLLNSTSGLVTQDHHNFPRVDRSITQLQQYAETLRSRTSKFRSVENQISASRLLARQGFDASRLTQDVVTLEIQPTVEDVFHVDTTNVEDYLKQVEESTIIAAIQESQMDTVNAFESYMEDCMVRDWASNKQQLLGLIAPHSGALHPPSLGGGYLTQSAGGGNVVNAAFGPLRLTPKEQAYVDVIGRANHAAANGDLAFNLVNEFTAACKANEDKTHETSMSTCWSLLGDMLTEVHASGATTPARLAEGMLQGAWKHLERGHAQHMRNTLLRHKLQAERGADPELLREVQAYITVKFGSKGLLDFQQPGGHDTSWIQVYFCLRNGWHEAALKAAEHVHDVSLSRLGEYGFKTLLEEWLRNGRHLPERQSGMLAHECERMMRDKVSLRGSLKYPYMLLLCVLLAGDNRALDALSATLAAQQLPPVLSTIEDYMWCKLAMVSVTGAGSGAVGGSPLGSYSGMGIVVPYTLHNLHTDLARWPSTYYSKQGKEPLLYVTVLMLSLQFHAALRFLWKDDTTRSFRVDAVHLAIALHQEQALTMELSASPNPQDTPHMYASMVHSYGRKFVSHDSSIALQYYMLAAVMKGNSIAVKGQMLRELLTESRDLLGSGGSLLGNNEAGLRAYVPDAEERKRLFEAVAYECQVAAQHEEAVELYMAAGRPRQALSILNQQLSNIMEKVVEEAVTGVAGRASEAAKRISELGRVAHGKIAESADAEGARREVEAFDQLCVIWELLLASRRGRQDMVLQRLHELSFIPLEKNRVEPCIRAAQRLHPSVLDRLQDVLSAAVVTINEQRVGASREKLFTLRANLDALCLFANSLSHRVPKQLYQKLCEVAASF